MPDNIIKPSAYSSVKCTTHEAIFKYIEQILFLQSGKCDSHSFFPDTHTNTSMVMIFQGSSKEGILRLFQNKLFNLLLIPLKAEVP